MGDGSTPVCAYGNHVSLSHRSRYMDRQVVDYVFHIRGVFMASHGSSHMRVGEAATMSLTSGERTLG